MPLKIEKSSRSRLMEEFNLSDYLERFWFLVNYKSKLL